MEDEPIDESAKANRLRTEIKLLKELKAIKDSRQLLIFVNKQFNEKTEILRQLNEKKRRKKKKDEIEVI